VNHLNILFNWMGAILALLVVVGVGRMFAPQFQSYREHQAELSKLEDDIRQEANKIRSLADKQERFKSDRDFVRQVAHEKGMAHPDEIVFRFEEAADRLSASDVQNNAP